VCLSQVILIRTLKARGRSVSQSVIVVDVQRCVFFIFSNGISQIDSGLAMALLFVMFFFLKFSRRCCCVLQGARS
jgi:hypothetical protein